MIRKLRRKFVLVNMLLVTVVLVGVLAGLCVSNYHSLKNESLMALRQAVSRPIGALPNKPSIGGGTRFDLGIRVPTFSVLVTQDGSVLQQSDNPVTVTDQVLEAAVTQSLASQTREGRLDGLSLRFLRQEAPDGIHLAFSDLSYEISGMRDYLLRSLVVLLLALAAFFPISLFLSRHALRPAELAWQQQRRFVADASHELKTPLTVILANLGLLLSHTQDPIGQHQSWVENAREEAIHMKVLVEDLLFLARSDADQSPPATGPVNVSDLVWNCTLSFEPVAFESGVTLTSQVAPELSMTGNEGQLRQLISILLDNAVKYAGQDGQVTLVLTGREGHPLLTVHNTGASISPQDLPHIFDRFYRVDESRTRTQGGFGLGLAIAKQIVQTHGGQITVESSPDQGTTFQVQL